MVPERQYKRWDHGEGAQDLGRVSRIIGPSNITEVGYLTGTASNRRGTRLCEAVSTLSV